jgi:hypothetical protein
MGYNKAFLDTHTIKQAFAPVDLNTAAITGARIGLANGQKVTVILELADSLTGGAVVVTLRQHTAASGGSSADLSVDRPYYTKAAAETKFTKVVPSSAAAAYDLSATYDTEPGQVVFEIESQDLNRDSSYTHFSIDLADGAVARIASAIYVLSECRSNPAYSIDV